MLDFRIKTFLELCRLKNYTKTAHSLHITQPAVTQHIQYLEREYGMNFFDHEARELTLTPKGQIFYWSALTMEANSRKIHELMQQPVAAARYFRFGATLSIGEYLMPPILAAYLKEYPQNRLSMLVENTAALLKKLDGGEIDFAVVEGRFDKNAYSHVLLANEKFIAVCAADFPIQEEMLMDDITKYPLIIREKGSGTRWILEDILAEHNLSIGQFEKLSEMGNFAVIKHLVQEKLGLTFAYEYVVRREIREGKLKKVTIQNFQAAREFNFVYLKDSIFEKEYLEFYRYCMTGVGLLLGEGTWSLMNP
ncbi:LysR family transcriptional regulator [Robinsoniella sp. KNHs210]|uniref:LysR family transcriptional regulator n=1 Tax=Robinsoniella sp. KNHs210 TaxID=1469950 RepID=UPI0005C7A90A|nr:LysR family transcriptional regulator [Robinsoniella sp. KNHs210]